jgi:hypothetical protein
MTKTTRLYVDVDYNPEVTDPEGLSNALDTLMETAMSTPGILDEYDDPQVGAFYILKTPMVVKMSEIERVVGVDEHAAAVLPGEDISEEEIKRRESGETEPYFCRARITLKIPFGPEIDLPERPSGYIEHTIESPGLWGIWCAGGQPDPQDEQYLADVFGEERHTLVNMLTTMGIEVKEDVVLCRYADCPEGNTVGGEDDDVTCPKCRSDLGLDPVEDEEKIKYFSEEDESLAAAVCMLREAADLCAAADPQAKDAILSLAHDLAATVVKGGAS